MGRGKLFFWVKLNLTTYKLHHFRSTGEQNGVFVFPAGCSFWSVIGFQGTLTKKPT